MLQFLVHACHRNADGNGEMPDSQVLHQLIAVINIVLNTVGHQHTNDPAPAQSFHTQSSANRTVLAAGNTNHRIASRAVLVKPVPYPLNQILFYLLNIQFHKPSCSRRGNFLLRRDTMFS